MKRKISLTFAACVALIALVVVYKNSQVSTAKTPETTAISQTLNAFDKSTESVDNQLIATVLQNSTEKRPLSILPKKRVKHDHEASENEAENEEADADAAPLVNGKRLSKQQRINEAIALEIERTMTLPSATYPKNALRKRLNKPVVNKRN